MTHCKLKKVQIIWDNGNSDNDNDNDNDNDTDDEIRRSSQLRTLLKRVVVNRT